MRLQVKAELLPDAFLDVWAYRLAVHASSTLGTVVSTLGDSDAATYFAASDDSATALLLETLSVSRLMGDAALGTSYAIEAAAITITGVAVPEAMLTTTEAAYLLTGSNPISVLNYEVGVPLWIGAARHLKIVQSSGLENDAVFANQLAYNHLLSATLTKFGKSLEATKVLMLGVATYLYGRQGWMVSPGADEYRAKEWSGNADFVRGGGCDFGSYSTGIYTDVAVEIGPGLYYYRCDWGLASSLGFYAPWEDEGVAPPINESLTRWIVDPNYEDTRNEIGIYIDENLVRWWQAYEYCNVSKDDRRPGCVPLSSRAIL